MLTTQKLRLLISVYDIEETDQSIVIRYWKGNQDKSLIVDKKVNIRQMKWVDGPVSQWDAINIIVDEEQRAEIQGVLHFFTSTSNPFNN
jgi:hypothetical protein